jgi:hypothetical protein
MQKRVAGILGKPPGTTVDFRGRVPRPHQGRIRDEDLRGVENDDARGAFAPCGFL